MRRSPRFLLPCLALLLAPLFATQRASAGGFYLTDRGVRPMAQGGAFVAGAEGPEALWYNPAGLSGSGRSVRVEGMVTLLDASFTRVDDAGNVRPKVDLDQPILPIPLLGYTDNFGSDHFTWGIALFVPNMQAYNWPKNGAQRYSLVSTDNSVVAHLALGGAYHIGGFSLGLAPTLVVGRFRTDTVFSACDGVTCAQVEDPEYDSPSTVDLQQFATFSLGIGVTYERSIAKFGASFNTPYNIQGKAKIKVGLPDSPIFDEATVQGDKVKLKVPFPWVARLGIQLRPLEGLRTEAAFVIEGWSVHDKISVDPQGITMKNIFGVGDYEVGSIDLKRGGKNSYSARLGGEYDFGEIPLIARAGISYDTTAFDKNVLTPITLDSNKVVLGMGATWKAGDTVDIDFVYGHVFLQDVNVRNSTIAQPTALRPEPLSKNIIGNGDYKMEANYFGLGLTYRPGGRPGAPAQPQGDASMSESASFTQ